MLSPPGHVRATKSEFAMWNAVSERKSSADELGAALTAAFAAPSLGLVTRELVPAVSLGRE